MPGILPYSCSGILSLAFETAFSSQSLRQLKIRAIGWGVNVPVVVGFRFLPASFRFGVFSLFSVLLILSPLAFPQASAPSSPEAQSAASPATKAPTAGEIQAAAEKELSSDPDLKAATTAKPAAPATQGPAGEHLPSKYDVSMIGQRNVGNGLDFYSMDREIALGRSLAQQVEGSARLVTDPVVNEYINRIGQNLVRNSDARVPFTIKILDTDEVNAFALPGGFFYVNSGLILAADNEAELAAVMAHEIAHVAARHATKNMTKAQIFNLASVPLIFIGGPVAYAISEVASIAVPLGVLKFSRDAEREADLLGLEYDYAAGYDPQAFVEFFEKLKVDEKKKQSLMAKAFATHPMNADRIKAAQEEISKYLPDRPEYVVNTSEFVDIKARLLTLESGRRLGGAKESRGPVLLRRTSSTSDTGASGGADQDDGTRPVLKRSNADEAAGASDGAASSAQKGDDNAPVLKRKTPDANQFYAAR